ncbi:HAD-like protein [Penicillium capsulatum]|nr:HAD-like protein [Penicillium capsulatum]
MADADDNPKVILAGLDGIFMHRPWERVLSAGESTTTLGRIMSTSTWMEYDTGELNEAECVTRLVEEYHLKSDDLTAATHDVRKTISYDTTMALRDRWGEKFWSVFDNVFNSTALGVRKSDLRFYAFVLDYIQAVPRQTFVVDERPENVAAALSLGMKGTFDTSDLRRTLINLVGDPVDRGLAFLWRQDPKLVHSTLDEVKQFIDKYGYVSIYFDKTRPQTGAVIWLNVLTLFYKYGRGHKLPHTLEWVYNILLNRAYIKGTRYYPNAGWFLYYMVRFLEAAKDDTLHAGFDALLRARVAERTGAPGDPYCLAMRVLACKDLGIENYPDRQRLAEIQEEDGGWESPCMYLFPGTKRDVGNRGTSTAFAVKALEGWDSGK